MSETKWTKGQWHLDAVLQSAIFCRGRIVAELSKDFRSDKFGNAHLIAAAPDLYEALAWYVENDDTNENQTGNEFWLEGRERARSALSRARGETE